MTTQNRLGAAAAIAMLGWATSSSALEPASFGSGGVLVTPTLGLSYVDDDNVRANTSNESGTATIVSPRINVRFGQGNATGRLDYGLTHRMYGSFTGEDTTDQSLAGSTSLTFNPQNALDLGAAWSTTESNGAAGALIDEYTDTSLNALYRFGTDRALINTDVGWKIDRKQSDNAANLDQERDVTTLNGVVYVRVSPRTQGLFEVRHTDSAYDSATLKDNERLAYLVGARWQATAFTSGSARIGYADQSFDRPGKADESSTVWELAMTWAPRSYSQVNLSASQTLEDGDDAARSSEQMRYSIDWTHDWAIPVSTALAISQIDDDYDDGRSDERMEFSARAAYEVSRRFDIGVRYAYTDKTSTVNAEAYDRERLGLFIDVGL